MFSRREKAWVHNLVLWASISVAIVISPGYSFDPVNIPKFFILVPIALMSMGFCLTNFLHIRKEYWIYLLSRFNLNSVERGVCC